MPVVDMCLFLGMITYSFSTRVSSTQWTSVGSAGTNQCTTSPRQTRCSFGSNRTIPSIQQGSPLALAGLKRVNVSKIIN